MQVHPRLCRWRLSILSLILIQLLLYLHKLKLNEVVRTHLLLLQQMAGGSWRGVVLGLWWTLRPRLRSPQRLAHPRLPPPWRPPPWRLSPALMLDPHQEALQVRLGCPPFMSLQPPGLVPSASPSSLQGRGSAWSGSSGDES